MERDGMQLFLRLPEGRTVVVPQEHGLSSNARVEELEEIVERECGVPSGQQRLLLRGLQLRRGLQLQEYEVHDCETVQVLLRIKGGMPASAPRIKMPANNRMHSSAALRTTDMWSSVIGNDFGKANDAAAVAGAGAGGNAYEMNQNLMALARLSGAAKGSATRGSCKKCGEIGHLAFQCFNMLSGKKQQVDDVSSTSSESEDEDNRSTTSTISSTSSEGDGDRKRKSSSVGKKRVREDDFFEKGIPDKKKKKSDKKDKKKKDKKSKKHKKEKKSKKDKKEKKSKKDRD